MFNSVSKGPRPPLSQPSPLLRINRRLYRLRSRCRWQHFPLRCNLLLSQRHLPLRCNLPLSQRHLPLRCNLPLSQRHLPLRCNRFLWPYNRPRLQLRLLLQCNLLLLRPYLLSRCNRCRPQLCLLSRSQHRWLNSLRFSSNSPLLLSRWFR